MTDVGNERIYDSDTTDTQSRHWNGTPVPKSGTESAMRPLESGDEGRVVTVQRIP